MFKFTYCAWVLASLKQRVGSDSTSTLIEREWTYVQRAYRNPAKQNAAMSIRTTNWTSMARNERTIRLFRNVTNASLVGGLGRVTKRVSGCYLGKMNYGPIFS